MAGQFLERSVTPQLGSFSLDELDHHQCHTKTFVQHHITVTIGIQQMVSLPMKFSDDWE